ncbi:hypothetical protein BSFA1_02720 [Burkholderia sp. SFA1]|nr:hypothetical protein BSFA1_02720 [Burkholderia sp. SFA1]
MIMKSPSMRSAKMAASDTVARSSGALRRVDVADGLDIRNGKWMRVASGLACGAARRGRLVLARNGTIWDARPENAARGPASPRAGRPARIRP